MKQPSGRPASDHVPKGPERAPLRGFIIIIGGYLFMAAGLILGISMSEYGDAVSSGILGGGIGGGVSLILLGRHLRTRDAKFSLRDSSKPPIVYFRAFQDEGIDRPIVAADILWHLTATLTNESVMASGLRKLGPPVAVGRPGDKMAPVGFDRFYVQASENWQSQVLELIRRAQCIIIRAGQSQGLFWEIMSTVKLSSPTKVIIFLPYKVTRIEKKRQRQYEEFYNAAVKFFPKGLPKRVGKTLFIAFTPSWLPVCLEAKGKSRNFRGTKLQRHLASLGVDQESAKVLVEILPKFATKRVSALNLIIITILFLLFIATLMVVGG